jgi:RNA polymerase sigma-70 factor (ECF subfamily)
MNGSDQHLVSRIAEGDTDAFAAFYDRHVAAVFGLLLKLLGQRNDAEDVLQETFYQVWSRARQYDPARSDPRVWLLLIARSRALDHLRRRRIPAGTPGDGALVCECDPAQLLEQLEAAQGLREALTRLPEEQRSAICLAFYGGLTHEEVARSQAVALGTVKTRIRLGMQRLRRLLCPVPEVSTR